jgi:putative addiction module CopG family antidote
MAKVLDPQLEAMLQEKVDAGLYSDTDEALEAAVRLLDERDRRLQWLRAELAIAEEQIERGELIDYTPELLEQITRESEESARRGRPIRDAVVVGSSD